MALLATLTALPPAPARAEIKVPALISDDMVLQRSPQARLWGTADPGEAVTATLATASAKTTAGADGKWRLTLDTSKLPEGPHQLILEGSNKVTIRNVVVGEVWFCSGQSNMEMAVSGVLKANEEAARSENPMIRHFQVGRRTSAKPASDLQGRWVLASRETTASFTAAGYFFAREVNARMKVPVGLINASWGGTLGQPWISFAGLEADPGLRAQRDERLRAFQENDARTKAFAEALPGWERQNGRADETNKGEAEGWHRPEAEIAGWIPIDGTDTFRKLKLENAGAVWYRTTFELTEAEAKHEATLNVGHVTGSSLVYINGQKLAETPVTTPSSDTIMRNAVIPAKALHSGTNTLAIRCFSSDLDGGLRWRSLPLQLANKKMSLDKNWRVRVEATFAPLDKTAMATRPKAEFVLPQNVPTMLFNGMVAPATSMTIAGALWYQGEANVGTAAGYRAVLPALIADWRQQFGLPNAPFYICQLPNFGRTNPNPIESAFAELRDAQFVTTRKLPNTGLAVLLDVGEAGDIHPRNKQEVGKRLAALALHHTYGQKQVVPSGPLYASSQIEGGKIRVKFDELGGDLVARPVPETYVISSTKNETAPVAVPRPGSQLQGFAICGEDRKWIWADASIDGKTVLVSNPEVPKPVAVRYAWADSPVFNLYNAAGLPASPFRTDDFPLSTQGRQ